MDELIAISALVGDRNYRVKINPSDEAVVRNTLKTINDRIVEFKTQFAGKDMQDYVSMVLLWYATEQNDALAGRLEEQELSEKLGLIEKMLDARD